MVMKRCIAMKNCEEERECIAFPNRMYAMVASNRMANLI